MELVVRRSFAVINQCAAMVAVGLAGCTQVPTVPLASGAPASLLILSAREITDTIDAPLAEPLTVKLVDSAGNFVPGKIVKFLAPPPLEGVSYRGPVLVGATLAGAGQTAYSVATDSLGVARAYMKTTPAVGRFFVRAQTAEPGLSDSVLIAVRPGAPVRITLAPKDTAVYGGATYPLVVRAFDHGGNPPLEPIALTVRRPGVASLDGDGVVQANATGRTYAVASVGSVRDSAGVSVVPHGTILAVNRRYSSGETMAFFLR